MGSVVVIGARLVRLVRASLAVAGSDTGALIIANMGYALTGLVTGVVTARALGAQGRGDLAVIVFWPTLLSTIADLGLSEAMTLRVARDRSELRSAIRAAIQIAAASTVVAACVGWAVLPAFLRPEQQVLLSGSRWMLLLIPANLASLPQIGALLGLGRFRTVAVVRSLSVAAYLVCVLVAVAAGARDPMTFAWLTVVSRALPLPIAAIALFNDLRAPAKGGGTGVRAQASEGARLQAARLASVLSASEDRAIASWTLSQANIGHWNVASTLAFLFPFIGQGISQQVFARMPTSTPDQRGALLGRAYVRSVALTGALAVVAVPLLPLAIPLMFGVGFREAVLPAALVTTAAVFVAGANTIQAGARAMGRNDTCVASEIAGMVAMALAAIPAISAGGLAGLGVAYLIGRLICLGWLIRSVGGSLGRTADWIPGSPGFLRSCVAEVKGIRGALDAGAGDG